MVVVFLFFLWLLVVVVVVSCGCCGVLWWVVVGCGGFLVDVLSKACGPPCAYCLLAVIVSCCSGAQASKHFW